MHSAAGPGGVNGGRPPPRRRVKANTYKPLDVIGGVSRGPVTRQRVSLTLPPAVVQIADDWMREGRAPSRSSAFAALMREGIAAVEARGVPLAE